jgi:enterochelin esterase-like enzyme
VLALIAAIAAALAPPPPGFHVVAVGPSGGQIWRGPIAGARRPAMIYVPPGYSDARRCPVVYLLAGMPGSPWSYVRSLSLASVADSLIGRGEARPFVAVMPPGGRAVTTTASGRDRGSYLVRSVLPGTQAHLAVSGDRTIAGLSAGGFGAVDIALRHPRLFRRVESWGGYFSPFRDGPLHHVSREEVPARAPRPQARRVGAAASRRPTLDLRA